MCRRYPLPFRTYGDVEPAGLEISVTCDKCGRSVLIDAGSEAMRDRPLCGGRIAVMHLHGGPRMPGTDRFLDRGKYGQ
jgi:hypothetical protein